MSLAILTSYVLNIFRTLICPSSGACDCAVELPHRLLCSRFVVCWRFGAAGLEWCPCCRLKLKWNKIATDIKLVFYSSTIQVAIFELCHYCSQWAVCCFKHIATINVTARYGLRITLSVVSTNTSASSAASSEIHELQRSIVVRRTRPYF